MARVLRRSRPVGLSLSAAVVLALLAGCGPEATPGVVLGSASPPPTTTAAPSPVATTTAAPVPTTRAPGPVAAGDGRCSTAQLRVSVVPGDSAAGHLGLRIVFTNTASGSCTMFGYPGVSFVNGAAGTQVNDPALRAGGPSVLVPVAAGGSAHADLLLTQVGDYPAGECQPVTVAGVRVYPPDETVAAFAPSTQQVCSVKGTGVAQVYPVRGGADGP